jgi:uncharacterized damage-inducible protein DinB
VSVLQSILLGGRGTASVERILGGLSRETASQSVPGLPFTLYGLLWHLEFTQNLLLARISGEETSAESAPELWPKGVPSEDEWEDLISRLRAGVYEASEFASDPGQLSEEDRSLLEVLAMHNAYHWGQVVVLRRLLGDWPADAE